MEGRVRKGPARGSCVYISELCSRVAMDEVLRTEGFDPNNKGDLTQRAWALAWYELLKMDEQQKSMEYGEAILKFEDLMYHQYVKLMKRYLPDVEIVERPRVWGADVNARFAFNTFATHYKKWDKEFTQEEKQKYELFYQRMVRSFGHADLFILPIGAHQLTVEQEKMDAQAAELPEKFVPRENPGDAYTDEDYALANRDIDWGLSGYNVHLASLNNMLTVDGPKSKQKKVPADDVENHFQGLDYDKWVAFNDLPESAQKAVSKVYNGRVIEGSYWSYW